MKTQDLPKAKDMPYWKTGKGGIEGWIDKIRRLVEGAGGAVLSEAFADQGGQCAFLIVFELEGEAFRIVWPVLPVDHNRDFPAARRQAITMLYHDVKARVVTSWVHGARSAFLGYLLLPNGQTAGQMSGDEIQATLPRLLTGGGS